MAKEIIIKRGDKIVCPNCGHKAKRWSGHSDYSFLCWCKAMVKMKVEDGHARVYVKELE